MKFMDLPTTDRKGRPLEPVENAVIRSVSISNEDHGCLTAWLFLDIGEGSGCGFGGFALGSYKGEDNLRPTKGNWAAFWITRCIETVLDGKDEAYGKWEDLVGRPVRVIGEGLGGQIVAVGHFRQDKWFCPRVELKDHQ